MRALVIYESMYGNTHQIAQAIGEGLDLLDGVQVLSVADVDRSMLENADLIVVGGPTHAHGMSRESTRKAALDAAGKPGKGLHVDPAAAGVGLRDWAESIGALHGKAAAFDTRTNGPGVFTGHASKGIAKMLREHGLDLIAQPESFLVDKDNHLLVGERGRALVWGENLAHALVAASSQMRLH
jgi:Flavodoxin domain